MLEGQHMKEKFLLSDNQIIMNYNKAYPKNREALLSSSTFREFILHFTLSIKEDFPELYEYVTIHGKYSAEEAAQEFQTFLRILSIFKIEEMESEFLQERDLLLDYIEEMYKYWRSMQRFGFMDSDMAIDFGINTLVYRDSAMNDLILRTFRLFEEKIQGRPNLVYRQVQAGTNSCFSVYTLDEETFYSEDYKALKDIPMIGTVMLRTPMILHPKSNKRSGMFSETKENPIDHLCIDPDKWFCFPIKVGTSLCFVYFNPEYTATALSLANLFEVATVEEASKKPDLVVIFGNEDGRNATEFYHDEKNDIWVGCLSHHPRIEYFGYMKKIVLTLHNLAMMKKGWLPIHGAFVNVVLKDGRTKGIMFMGDSGAGKSESIEALKAVGNAYFKQIDVIFDDMGSIHIEDGVPYGQGTEIGAFVRLDDLDPGTPYRDMDRSIFMGPENPNSRVIVPVSKYNDVISNHKIDLFAYANNYTDEIGLKELSVDEVKETCKLGKRMALGTTAEVGISTTYFANPFGPMQKQEVCDPLIDQVFQSLKDNGIFVGEIYTHLGFDKMNRHGLNEAAQQLFEFIVKKED